MGQDAQNDKSPIRRPGFCYMEPLLSGDLGEFVFLPNGSAFLRLDELH
jgi:hypothetical protein